MNLMYFEKWAWSYLGIVVEALPFLLIGAVISSTIQMYLSENTIKKILPKQSFKTYIIAGLCGIFIPVCECAIVPITRSLMKKGVPIGIGTTFMLAVPIINPIVIASTYYAFEGDITMVLIRIVGGFIAAVLIGAIIGRIFKKDRIENLGKDITSGEGCDCCTINNNYYTTFSSKLKNLVVNASNEFLNISMYFIFGALLSSIFVVFIGDNLFKDFSVGNIFGIMIMMILAFLLSLCSEADAFIARGFTENFGLPAVIAFLIFGPMLDLKNTVLALGYFKKKFVLKLMMVTILVIFGISISTVFIFN